MADPHSLGNFIVIDQRWRGCNPRKPVEFVRRGQLVRWKRYTVLQTFSPVCSPERKMALCLGSEHTLLCPSFKDITQ